MPSRLVTKHKKIERNVGLLLQRDAKDTRLSVAITACGGVRLGPRPGLVGSPGSEKDVLRVAHDRQSE